MKPYYVYAHYIPGQPDPFYVGKGRGARAWNFYNRSKWWKRVVDKHCPEGPVVKMLAEEAAEDEAFTIERFWIAVFGRKNAHNEGCLVNLTDGGEGLCGLKRSEDTRRKMSDALKGENNPMFGKKGEDSPSFGRVHTAATKKKMVDAWKSRGPVSEVTKLKMSESRKGSGNSFFGRTHSEETKLKQSEAKKGVNNAGFGKNLSPETREKLSNALKGKKRTPETCRRISESKTGSKHPNFGKKRSPETRKRQSESLKGKGFSDAHRKSIAEAQRMRRMREKEAREVQR